MKTALIIIDIQNDYFAGGAYPLFKPVKAAQNAALLLAKFRELGWPIFHIQHISTRDGASFFLPESEGAKIHELVAPAQGEPVVIKHAPDSFLNTELGYELERLEVEQLVVCGMMSHICVDTTVRSAAGKGYKILLAHDACASRELEFGGEKIAASSVHGAFMAAMSGFFAKVESSAEILAQLK